MNLLTTRSALAGHLPLSHGTVTASEVWPDPVLEVIPFRGQAEAVSAALRAACGVGLPEPGRAETAGDVRALSIGPGGRTLILGAAPELPGAACVDLSDAFATARVEGGEVEAVLARLVPGDLSPQAFPEGAVARTLIAHMTGTVIRVGPVAFDLMVFRSMAGTLAHDLDRAMAGVAARG